MQGGFVYWSICMKKAVCFCAYCTLLIRKRKEFAVLFSIARNSQNVKQFSVIFDEKICQTLSTFPKRYPAKTIGAMAGAGSTDTGELN